MPFLRGPSPIRRTWKYLEAGNLVLKDRVKIFTINYNTKGEHHAGARAFVFWNLPQIQYKNQNIQFVYFRNMTPSPFIRCFLYDEKEVLMDIDGKDRFQIHDHLKKIIGKSEKSLAAEAVVKEQVKNPANFGAEYERHCICEVLGQVPCSSVLVFPNHMRGKFRHQQPDD